MLAVATLGLLPQVADAEHPVRWLSEQPLATQLEFFALAGIVEAGASLPRIENLFELKPDEAPGRIRPLGPPTDGAQRTEDLVGRLAMLAAAAALAADRLDAWGA